MMSGPRDHSASWELCATAAAVAVKQREYQRAIGLYRQSQTMMQQALVVARKLPSASAAATARTTLQNAYADTQLAIVKCYVKLRQDDAALREVRSKQANIQSNPHSSELINCLPTTTSLICCDACVVVLQLQDIPPNNRSLAAVALAASLYRRHKETQEYVVDRAARLVPSRVAHSLTGSFMSAAKRLPTIKRSSAVTLSLSRPSWHCWSSVSIRAPSTSSCRERPMPSHSRVPPTVLLPLLLPVLPPLAWQRHPLCQTLRLLLRSLIPIPSRPSCRHRRRRARTRACSERRNNRPQPQRHRWQPTVVPCSRRRSRASAPRECSSTP